MSRTQGLVGVLRVVLALAFLALLLGQLRALPAMYDDWVRDAPLAPGSGWVLPVAELQLLCVQTIVVCTWRLLSMVRDDRIFTDDALVWVDTIVGAMVCGGSSLLAGLLLLAAEGASRPSPVLLGLLGVAWAVAALLMVVMRALLRQATSLRSELAGVV